MIAALLYNNLAMTSPYWCSPSSLCLCHINIGLSVAGFVRRWLLWCFELRAHAAVAPAAIFSVAKYSKCANDTMLNWKMKSWMVTRVTIWLLWTWCQSKQSLSFCRTFHPHFINTTMPMSCADVHSGAPMSYFLNRQVGMGYQALNFWSRANYVYKMSCMDACLQNKQHI